MKLKLELKPISTNQLFINVRNYRALSKKYVKWKKQFTKLVNEQIKPEYFNLSQEPYLNLCITVFTSSFFTRENVLSKKSGDVDNYAKAIIDTLLGDILKIEDHKLLTVVLSKLPGNDIIEISLEKAILP